MPSHEVIPVVAVFMVGTMALMARAIAGIGAGMMLQLGWMLMGQLHLGSGTMRDAAGLTIFMDIAGVALAFSLRRHIDWELVLVAGVPWASFEVLGVLLLLEAHKQRSPWLRRSFGFVLVFVLLWDIADMLQQRRRVRAKGPRAQVVGRPDEESAALSSNRGEPEVVVRRLPPTEQLEEEGPSFRLRSARGIGLSVFLGIFGGTLKGFYAVPLPALTLFVFCSGIDKDVWRASGLVIQLLATPIKAYVFFVLNAQYQPAMQWQYVAISTAAIVMLPLANWLAARFNQKDFKSFVRVMVATGCASNLTTETPVMLWASLCTLVLAATCSLCECRSRHRKENEAADGGKALSPKGSRSSKKGQMYQSPGDNDAEESATLAVDEVGHEDASDAKANESESSADLNGTALQKPDDSDGGP